MSNVIYTSKGFFKKDGDWKMLKYFDSKFPDIADKVPTAKRMLAYREMIKREIHENNIVEFEVGMLISKEA